MVLLLAEFQLIFNEAPSFEESPSVRNFTQMMVVKSAQIATYVHKNVRQQLGEIKTGLYYGDMKHVPNES